MWQTQMRGLSVCCLQWLLIQALIPLPQDPALLSTRTSHTTLIRVMAFLPEQTLMLWPRTKSDMLWDLFQTQVRSYPEPLFWTYIGFALAPRRPVFQQPHAS